VEDIPAGLRLCRASGWNQLDDDWRVFVTSPGSGGFLAEKDGRAVGSVAFLRYDSFAWIAMIIVDPQERGAGIGTQLMNQALLALKDAACVGLDATPAGELLYRHFDFVNDHHMARYKSAVEPGIPFGRARRMDAADLPDVLRRDRDVFGADRGDLLVSLFRRAPECAWIADSGYAFGRPGHLYHQLGPIVADDFDTARTLVTHCRSALAGRRFAIDAPQRDPEWLEWLKSIGFEEERPFVRMFRRGDKRPRLMGLQYAIAGPEFG
jgi:GNAT superfamily N-acetyltransferase